MMTFAAVFSPFAYPPEHLRQALHRIFPFARGLFEDKVANFWCALNVIVKLRDLASISTLAKLSLAATLLATLPGMIITLLISWRAMMDRRPPSPDKVDKQSQLKMPPTLGLLLHAMFSSAMAFFLFSFQVHEKSILLPLMPLTLLMAAKEPGTGSGEWEWAALVNNVAMFR